jgi:hypothetical protein
LILAFLGDAGVVGRVAMAAVGWEWKWKWKWLVMVTILSGFDAPLGQGLGLPPPRGIIVEK